MFRSSLSGVCFLCRLRSPVVPFPMWSALPPQSTMRRSDSPWPIGRPPYRWYTLPRLRRRPWGLPGSSTSLFLRAALSDPGRSPRISPMRSLCVGFRCGNAVATCSSVDEAELLVGVRSPLWPTGFSVYASNVLFGSSRCRALLLTLSGRDASIYLTTSFTPATLDTGGWLSLTRQGLAPCKRCRA